MQTSAAKIQGFIGIVAITVGNLAAIMTHVDEIGQYVFKVLGTEWVYSFHSYLLYGACILLLVGYGSLTYWLYRNFVAGRSWKIKGAFCVAAVFRRCFASGPFADDFSARRDYEPETRTSIADMPPITLKQGSALF